MHWRENLNVSYVIKPLHISEVSKDIKEHTLGRNYTNIIKVIKPLLLSTPFKILRQNCITEKNPINVWQNFGTSWWSIHE